MEILILNEQEIRDCVHIDEIAIEADIEAAQ